MRLAPPLLVLLLLAGCDFLDRPPLERSFGTPYDLVLEPASGPGGGGEGPFLSGDGILYVLVRYTGGCTEHVFRLESELTDAVATLWLVHADNGESCEAVIVDVVSVPLSADVLARPRIVLAGPDGSEVVVRDLAADGSDAP